MKKMILLMVVLVLLVGMADYALADSNAVVRGINGVEGMEDAKGIEMTFSDFEEITGLDYSPMGGVESFGAIYLNGSGILIYHPAAYVGSEDIWVWSFGEKRDPLETIVEVFNQYGYGRVCTVGLLDDEEITMIGYVEGMTYEESGNEKTFGNFDDFLDELCEWGGIERPAAGNRTYTSERSGSAGKEPFDNLYFSNFLFDESVGWATISGDVANGNGFAVDGTFYVVFYKNGRVIHREHVMLGEIPAYSTGVWSGFMEAVDYDRVEYADSSVGKAY